MNKISKIALGICMLCMLLVATAGPALSQERPIVNLMIDVDVAPTHSPEEIKTAGDSLIKLINEIDPKGRNATLFVSGEMATVYRLGITLQGTLSNHELALYGNKTGESLSSISKADQEAILTDANIQLYHCYVCGGKHVNARGFRPQNFDQNDDTLHILENLSLLYDAGFQEGLIYLPGHENDTWPYLITGYKLYAVPVSSAPVKGEKMVLYDKSAKEKGIGGPEWYDLLQAKFDENAKAGNPTAIIFSNLVSAEGDYYDAYKNFLDYADSKGANFVTSFQLLDMAATKANAVIPELEQATKAWTDVNASEKGSVAQCPTCDKIAAGKAGSIITFKVQKIAGNCTAPPCNQISTNATKAA